MPELCLYIPMNSKLQSISLNGHPDCIDQLSSTLPYVDQASSTTDLVQISHCPLLCFCASSQHGCKPLLQQACPWHYYSICIFFYYTYGTQCLENHTNTYIHVHIHFWHFLQYNAAQYSCLFKGRQHSIVHINIVKCAFSYRMVSLSCFTVLGLP